MTAPKKELFIWWTSSAEMASIGERAPETLPAYVREQWAQRFGRNGRCRLWVDPKFGPREIAEWPKTNIARMLQEGTSAGIVFVSTDLQLFKGVPGIITDFRVRILVI